MYYKSKDSWKRLEGEKVCYSFSILTLFPCFSSAPCPHSRTENNVNPVSLEIHLLPFNFWKRWVTSIKSIIFNSVKKNLTLSVTLFPTKAWAQQASRTLGVLWAGSSSSPAWEQENPLKTGVHWQELVQPRRLQPPVQCWPEAAKRNSRSQGKKPWLKAGEVKLTSLQMKTAHMLCPGLKYMAKTRLQSAWKARKK